MVSPIRLKANPAGTAIVNAVVPPESSPRSRRKRVSGASWSSWRARPRTSVNGCKPRTLMLLRLEGPRVVEAKLARVDREDELLHLGLISGG